MPSRKKVTIRRKTKKSGSKKTSQSTKRAPKPSLSHQKRLKNRHILGMGSSDEKFLTFPQMNPMPVLEIDPSGRIIYMNPAAKRLFPDLPSARLKHPYLSGILSSVEKLRAENKQWIVREVQVGTTWYDQTVFPAEGGLRIRIYAVDITKRKRAEEALQQAKDHLGIRVRERTMELEQTNRRLEEEIAERRRAEEAVKAGRQRFNDVLETLPAYLVLLTPDYHVLFANRFFRERFGESHGRRCYEYLFGRAEPCEICETYSVLKTMKPHEWEWTGPDDRNYDIYGFPFTDTDGSTLILEMGIDITERKKVEAELRSHKEHLEEMVKQRTGELEGRNYQLAAEISGRERIEEALRTSEEQAKDQASHLQALLDVAPAVIWIAHDRECRKITGNRFGEELLRVKEGTNVSKSGDEVERLAHFRVFKDGKELAPEEMPIQQVAASGRELHDYTEDVVFDDGSVRSLLGDVTPLFNARGEPDGAIAVFMDITERKKAEEALRVSLDRYRSYIEATGQLGWTTNADGEIVEDISSWRSYTGQTYEEIKGWGWSKALHPDDLEHTTQVWRKAIATKRLYEVEYRVRRYDGIYRHFMARGIPVLREDGSVREWVGTCVDITERKKIEEALRDSEERLNRAQEIAHLGSWELDLLNNRLSWSDEVYRIFGLKPQEFGATYESFLEAVHPDDRKTVDAAYSGSLSEGRDCYEIEHRVVRKATGEVRIVHEKCEHIRDDHGRIVRSVGMVQDITERKKVEEEIRALNEHLKQHEAELAASNKELEAFSYSVSHDLRAPLRNIDGFSQALLEDYADKLDQKGQDYLRRVRAATQRMGELIDDLLGLSVMIRKEMRLEEVDLSEQARLVMEELRNATPEREVDVVIQEKMRASGDPLLLRQTLENLLGNAWKFTSKHPRARIEFGSIENEGKKTFFIKDDGVGFDMKYINKMFIPFQRLHSTSEFSGNGIGLAIVKRVIDRHGGSVWAEGEVGKGATFYFTFE